MITSVEIIDAFEKATPQEQNAFVKSLTQDEVFMETLVQNKDFMRRHLFELIIPAQFETTKRLIK